MNAKRWNYETVQKDVIHQYHSVILPEKKQSLFETKLVQTGGSTGNKRVRFGFMKPGVVG